VSEPLKPEMALEPDMLIAIEHLTRKICGSRRGRRGLAEPSAALSRENAAIDAEGMADKNFIARCVQKIWL